MIRFGVHLRDSELHHWLRMREGAVHEGDANARSELGRNAWLGHPPAPCCGGATRVCLTIAYLVVCASRHCTHEILRQIRSDRQSVHILDGQTHNTRPVARKRTRWRLFFRALQNQELMAQRQDFSLQSCPSSEGSGHGKKQ